MFIHLFPAPSKLLILKVATSSILELASSIIDSNNGFLGGDDFVDVASALRFDLFSVFLTVWFRYSGSSNSIGLRFTLLLFTMLIMVSTTSSGKGVASS